MNFITKYLKQAGIFNTLLIVAGIIYDIVRVFSASNVFFVVTIVLQLIAYFFALNYAFNGYKKDASKYFKLFLYIFVLSILSTIITTLIHGKIQILSVIFAVVRLICVVIIMFAKDLGKTKSYVFAASSFVFSIINLFLQLNEGFHVKRLYSVLSSLILSAVLCVFVIAKYRDKESRGAK